jgi:hypothetical protein
MFATSVCGVVGKKNTMLMMNMYDTEVTAIGRLFKPQLNG